MASPFWRVVDWLGRFTTLQAIIQSQFLHTWFWPMSSAIVVAGSGVWQHEPIMWALMAGTIAFAAVTMGMLAVIGLRMQTSPQNKLMMKVVFHQDLTPREAPLIGTRQQRRSHDRQMLSSSQIVQNVSRTLDKVQLGVELTNNAFFAITAFLERAETEVEGEKPPPQHIPKTAGNNPARNFSQVHGRCNPDGPMAVSASQRKHGHAD